VISRIRRAIAVAVALLVATFTLGRVRVSWTGDPSATSGSGDPGRPAVTRSFGAARPPGPPA
jgi:hypothetical protein